MILARHIFRHLAYELRYGSMDSIGGYLGKNHSMVSYSRKQISKWLTYDKQLGKDLNAIRNMVLCNDQYAVINNILQSTPPGLMPDLMEHIKNWQQQNLKDL